MPKEAQERLTTFFAYKVWIDSRTGGYATVYWGVYQWIYYTVCHWIVHRILLPDQGE